MVTAPLRSILTKNHLPGLALTTPAFWGPFQSLIACRRACKTPTGEDSRFHVDIKNHVMHCAIMQGIRTIELQRGRSPRPG